MSVTERLAELGVTLPEPSRPAGVYRPAIRTGNLVYVSGQVAVQDGRIVHPGRLGDGVTLEQGREASRVAVISALAAAQQVLGGPDGLDGARIIRLVGYVACTPDFTEQPGVIDGASEFLRDAFGEEAGVGTRLALGVSALPAGSPVEIELILEVTGGAGEGA
ncbi:MAG: RidA family protein [Dehalococcoidia bacterium]|nr:RidA family protein [Dehalococcoidia bacterium]